MLAFYSSMLVSEYLLRFVAFLLTRCIYRFKASRQMDEPAFANWIRANSEPR